MRLYGAIQKVEPQNDGTVRVHGVATSEAVDDQGETVRADDNAEALQKRLDTYRMQTAPLIDYYANKGTLRIVDGMMPIAAVSEAIDRALSPLESLEGRS